MLKRMLALLCLVCLLVPMLPAALGETQESFYVYFDDARWMRTEPRANTPTVVNVPQRSVLKLTPVDDKYAFTTYRGKEGYVYYKNYKTIDYIDPNPDDAKYQATLDYLIDNSYVDMGVSVTTEDQILVLSTCTSDENVRFVVAGKLCS